MAEYKLTEETAVEEIQQWLHDLNIELNYDEVIDDFGTLVEAMMRGDVIRNDNLEFEHTLKYPLKNENGDIALEKLKYKRRVTAGDFSRAMNVKGGSVSGLLFNLSSIMVGEPVKLIEKLDMYDFNIMYKITGQYLPK